MSNAAYRFSGAGRAAVYRAIAEQRDMRHFRSDPVDQPVLARLLEAAHRAPSVGLTQLWRFVRITDHALRREIRALLEEERGRTVPEMDLASVACAIQNLLLAMPEGAKPVGILCLGHVEPFYPAPMLELEGWTRGRPLQELVFHNTWGETEPSA